MPHCDWALVRVRAEDGPVLGAGAEDRDKTGAKRKHLFKENIKENIKAEDETTTGAGDGAEDCLGLKLGQNLGLGYIWG